MNIQEKKKELHNILESANDELTNVLMEAVIEYQTKSKEEFVVPQEWIYEAEQRSTDLRNGKVEGLTLQESLNQIDDMLKHRRSV